LKYKWLILTVTTIGVLMAGIDARIVIIGLPQVIHAIGADAEQGGFAVSLNPAILIMSLTIRYTIVSQVAAGYTTTLTSGKEMFLQSIQTTCLWLAFVNILALIPSVLRNRI
jgi:hypothetical protein